MFIEKYLNTIYLDMFYDTYSTNYLKTIDENNFLIIYNYLRDKGFYFIDDIILNYLELFELEAKSVKRSISYLESLYGKDYIQVIGRNMTILNKVIDLAIKFSEEN